MVCMRKFKNLMISLCELVVENLLHHIQITHTTADHPQSITVLYAQWGKGFKERRGE